jgi:hypothetical protein
MRARACAYYGNGRDMVVVQHPRVGHACRVNASQDVTGWPQMPKESCQKDFWNRHECSDALTEFWEGANDLQDAIRTKSGEPMLAAAPKEHSRHLYPFCLALRLVEQGRSDIPHDVAEQFDIIIRQVRALLLNAEALREVISPEAIALLLEIRGEQDLERTIGDLPQLNAIQRDTARSILTSMEQRFALQD